MLAVFVPSAVNRVGAVPCRGSKTLASGTAIHRILATLDGDYFADFRHATSAISDVYSPPEESSDQGHSRT